MARLLNPQQFAEFCYERALACDGYIMCTIGQDPRTLSDWYYYGQYEGEQLKYALKWRKEAQRVWDCQGLADGYLTNLFGYLINVRARNNYATWCESIKGSGVIPAERRVPGAAVFVHNGSYISHVGFLVRPVIAGKPSGDWYVAEARGVKYGVVITKLHSRNWNRWGWMTRYFDYYGTYETTIETDGNLGYRLLKKGMAGDDVRQLQESLIALGYSCGRWGADGDFGSATLSAVKALQEDCRIPIDGIVGSITIDSINARLPEGDEPLPISKPTTQTYATVTGGSVYVRSEPSTDGMILAIVHKGDALPYRGETMENGWHAVMCEDERAWISGKYATLG